MNNKKETMRKFVGFINNEEEYGGLWLPNIQRPFVWSKEQIEKLFDSILREYPINTLLIWKTKAQVKIRKFIDNYTDEIRLTDFYVPKNEKAKLVVLDGQQRLQSLFIALKGSYNGEELYFDVLSGREEVDDVKYVFKFLSVQKISQETKWIRLKDLVFSNKGYYDLAEEVITRVGRESLADEQKELIRQNISNLIREFKDRDNIVYQELDSIDNPEVYHLNDVVEIFIRANSGGTPLGKSDLMFSLLTANWEEVEADLAELLEELNKGGYGFDRDFILKTSLVLIGAGAKYDVMKFRKDEHLEEIKTNWDNIKDAIKDIKDFVFGQTYLKSDRALVSYLPLIPLIYYRYSSAQQWRELNKKVLSFWLLQVLLTGAFSGSSDTILDVVVKDIRDKNTIDVDSINSIILNRGRSVHVTRENLLNTSYTDKQLYLIFSIWYQDFDFHPAYDGNLPTVDHIFPQSRLKKIKVVNPETGRQIMKYRTQERDQLANLMLLPKEVNIEEKHDMPPDEWLSKMSKDELKEHLIPQNPDLWKLERFDDFITARQQLIVEKFNKLGLVQS
jgi:uncharacterized protein with ParB-like and HNH nuclease domain